MIKIGVTMESNYFSTNIVPCLISMTPNPLEVTTSITEGLKMPERNNVQFLQSSSSLLTEDYVA